MEKLENEKDILVGKQDHVAKYREKWSDPKVREVEARRAVDRAELMQHAVAGAEFVKFECFDLNGYTAQSALWNTGDEDSDSRCVTSQWVYIEETAVETKMSPCAAAESKDPLG